MNVGRRQLQIMPDLLLVDADLNPYPTKHTGIFLSVQHLSCVNSFDFMHQMLNRGVPSERQD